ncbi:MAG: hypothetical protein GX600_02130 [Dehalococcoidia bacterium]|nr:hypothetical protein [Dehalococcoidia bacterium]
MAVENGDRVELISAGGILSMIAGVCLAAAGAALALATAYELELWQPDMPYLATLGSLLPADTGMPVFIGAVVVAVVGVVAVVAGAVLVNRSSYAMALEEQGFTDGISGLRHGGTSTTPPSAFATTTQGGVSSGATRPASELRGPATIRAGSATVIEAPRPVGSVSRAALKTGAASGQRQESQTAEVTTRTSRAQVESLDDKRLERVNAGFCTRRVPRGDMRTLVTGDVRPRAGDIVLARVEKVRQHRRLELPSGRKVRLEPGDEIVLACGNRYAADQFEGFVPERLGTCQLIAAGGLAAAEAGRARTMKAATEIALLGLVADTSGVPLNLMSYALPAPQVEGKRPPVLVVFGNSMSSGKTTTLRFLTRGLTAAGFKVGYAKLTGTGAGNDYFGVLDSGAWAVVDFTDAGLASTYRTPVSVLEGTSLNLIGHLINRGCDRILVEIADGLLQTETAGLVKSPVFRTLIDRALFSGVDPMSAVAGVRALSEQGFEVAGVSGLLTASPLPLREAKEACDVPVWTKEELADPKTASTIVVYRTPSREAHSGGVLERETVERGEQRTGESRESVKDVA